MISATSPRGEMQFQIVASSIHTERFIAFLATLIEAAARKIFLVVDNLRVLRTYFRHPAAHYAAARINGPG